MVSCYLQTPTMYRPDHQVGGWYMAQETAGLRVFWDGGITKGMPNFDIPWSNQSTGVATGLWSVRGHVVDVVDVAADTYPKFPISGVLSLNGHITVDHCPSMVEFTTPREGMPEEALQFAMENGAVFLKPSPTYYDELTALYESLPVNDYLCTQVQQKLPLDESEYRAQLDRYSKLHYKVILRDPEAVYSPSLVASALQIIGS